MVSKRPGKYVEVFVPKRDVVVDEMNDLDRFGKQIDRRVSLTGLGRRALIAMVPERTFIRPGVDHAGGIVGIVRIASVDHEDEPVVGAGLLRDASKRLLHFFRPIAGADHDGVGRGRGRVRHDPETLRASEEAPLHE